MRHAIGLCILTLALPHVPARAAEKWIHVASSNFEIYTTSDEKSANGALRLFEQVRNAFTEIIGVKLPDNKPVTIIAFRDASEYAPYRLRDGIIAYYMPLSRRDFIIMQDLDPEHSPVALHEYTHLIINQAGMKLPLWLNEGFAELYGTMKQAGGKILVGRMIPARMQVAQNGLIDLHEILNADTHSPLYNEANRAGVFYAESWAFVHMLKFSKPYATGFDRVLEAIGRGEPASDALEKVYNKSLAQIQKDLDAYVHGTKFSEGVIKAKLAKPDIEPRELPADPLDTAVLIAAIQYQATRRPEAVQTLEQLAASDPHRTAAFEALSWLHLASSHPELAVQPFERALAAGTHDAPLCMEVAVRLRSKISDAQYVGALRRAAELDPGIAAAEYLLAAYAFNHRDYTEAVARLHRVKKLERSNAFAYYQALAMAAFQIGNVAEAKSSAEQTLRFAATEQQRRIAKQVSEYVAGTRTASPIPMIENSLTDPHP